MIRLALLALALPALAQGPSLGQAQGALGRAYRAGEVWPVCCVVNAGGAPLEATLELRWGGQRRQAPIALGTGGSRRVWLYPIAYESAGPLQLSLRRGEAALASAELPAPDQPVRPAHLLIATLGCPPEQLAYLRGLDAVSPDILGRTRRAIALERPADMERGLEAVGLLPDRAIGLDAIDLLLLGPRAVQAEEGGSERVVLDWLRGGGGALITSEAASQRALARRLFREGPPRWEPRRAGASRPRAGAFFGLEGGERVWLDGSRRNHDLGSGRLIALRDSSILAPSQLDWNGTPLFWRDLADPWLLGRQRRSGLRDTELVPLLPEPPASRLGLTRWRLLVTLVASWLAVALGLALGGSRRVWLGAGLALACGAGATVWHLRQTPSEPLRLRALALLDGRAGAAHASAAGVLLIESRAPRAELQLPQRAHLELLRPQLADAQALTHQRQDEGWAIRESLARGQGRLLRLRLRSGAVVQLEVRGEGARRRLSYRSGEVALRGICLREEGRWWPLGGASALAPGGDPIPLVPGVQPLSRAELAARLLGDLPHPERALDTLRRLSAHGEQPPPLVDGEERPGTLLARVDLPLSALGIEGDDVVPALLRIALD